MTTNDHPRSWRTSVTTDPRAVVVPPVSDDKDGWDESIGRHGGHFLQSWGWGEFKARQGWIPERIAVEGASGLGLVQALYRHRGPVSIGYVPRGPVLPGDTNVSRTLFEQLDRLTKLHHAISLVVEPNSRLPLPGSYRDWGFVRGPAHFQPSRTVKVDLVDDDALMAKIHPKTRYNIRMAQRRGVEISIGTGSAEDIDRFYCLLTDTADRNAFAIHDRSYYADFLDIFGETAVLLFANVDRATVAALIAVRFGDEAMYMYGASSSAHRANGAGFIIQWEAMRWAREHGCHRYDMWGIPATDPPEAAKSDGDKLAGSYRDDWRGLYQFKVRFGGNVVAYPPTIERRYRPILAAVARSRFSHGG